MDYILAVVLAKSIALASGAVLPENTQPQIESTTVQVEQVEQQLKSEQFLTNF